MPLIDKPLKELQSYRGITPVPSDFDEYWAVALKELEANDPKPELVPSKTIHPHHAECFDLWFRGVGGARIHAQYMRPKKHQVAGPALLQFHGYSMNSGDWVDKLGYVGQGIAVAALDCRGQGGASEDNTPVKGDTLNGHFIRGLSDAPDKLLFRRIFLDAVQLARIVMSFPEINPARVGTTGASQGGALSIACAALEPRISRCVSIFPFLSDYQRVWELDLAKEAYAELRTFFRTFDPRHEREREIFTRLGYIDVKNLAPRIQAKVLMGLSLMDPSCPPSTQFAVYNQIKSEKECAIYPDFAHETLPGFSDLAFNFLAQL